MAGAGDRFVFRDGEKKYGGLFDNQDVIALVIAWLNKSRSTD